MTTPPAPALTRLAESYGLQSTYIDAEGRLITATAETILRLLQTLGCPISKPAQARALIKSEETKQKRTVLPWVYSHWGLGPLRLPLLAGDDWEVAPRFELFRENDDGSTTPLEEGPLPVLNSSRQIAISSLRPGYYILRASWKRGTEDCFLIVAPWRAYPLKGEPSWGLFFPLYAAWGKRLWGAGNFSTLAETLAHVEKLGGTCVSTLPLGAGFAWDQNDPSPYSPVSRRMWNEFYIDIESLPEWTTLPAVKTLAKSPEFIRQLRALRQSPHVDYRRGMALRWRALNLLTRNFFASSRGPEWGDFQHFLSQNPLARHYARFRAMTETENKKWSRWPKAWRKGLLPFQSPNEKSEQNYLYAQWRAARQMETLARNSKHKGLGLYLDFPLGVNPDGFDAWEGQTSLALKAEAGAPPDPVFRQGQCWGFSPWHPHTMRQDRYRLFRQSLRHAMAHASLLRLDHVMQFHRLYWVPRGSDATRGAYVRYPSDEFYAIISLESHKTRCAVVGENLGTVPPEVNASLRRHGIYEMYILQYERPSDTFGPLRSPPARAVAAVNTHDMEPFASYWGRSRRAFRRHWQEILKTQGYFLAKPGWTQALKALLSFLGKSAAPLVLVNWEDLWGETRPQNIPGTGPKSLNWSRPMKYNLEVLFRHKAALSFLRGLQKARRTGTSK